MVQLLASPPPTDDFNLDRWLILLWKLINQAGALRAFVTTPIPAGGTTGTGITVSSTDNFGVFFGSGVPTLSAAKGSLYMRSDGSSTSTRMYVNTDGATAWTSVTTAT